MDLKKQILIEDIPKVHHEIRIEEINIIRLPVVREIDLDFDYLVERLKCRLEK